MRRSPSSHPTPETGPPARSDLKKPKFRTLLGPGHHAPATPSTLGRDGITMVNDDGGRSPSVYPQNVIVVVEQVRRRGVAVGATLDMPAHAAVRPADADSVSLRS
jgi:hypothetical protein